MQNFRRSLFKSGLPSDGEAYLGLNLLSICLLGESDKGKFVGEESGRRVRSGLGPWGGLGRASQWVWTGLRQPQDMGRFTPVNG